MKASSGMMFSTVPDSIRPMVSTARSSGSTVRETSACSRPTIGAALQRQAQRLQPRGHLAGRARLLELEFGMGVEVAAELDEFADVGRDVRGCWHGRAAGA